MKTRKRFWPKNVYYMYTRCFILKTRKSPGALDPAVVLHPPPPRGAKYVTVTPDKGPWLCSKRHDEYFFGQVKTGGLGQVTPPPKKETMEKKKGITRPRPDSGVTKKNSKALGQSQVTFKVVSFWESTIRGLCIENSNTCSLIAKGFLQSVITTPYLRLTVTNSAVSNSR